MDRHPLLPEEDYWSTPFAKALLQSLDLFPGATVLDVAAGGGIPAFYLAEQVGPEGQVLAAATRRDGIRRSARAACSRAERLRACWSARWLRSGTGAPPMGRGS